MSEVPLQRKCFRACAARTRRCLFANRKSNLSAYAHTSLSHTLYLSHTLSLTHTSLSHTLSHTHTLSLTLSRTLSLSLTHSLSHTHTLALCTQERGSRHRKTSRYLSPGRASSRCVPEPKVNCRSPKVNFGSARQKSIAPQASGS